MSKKSHSLLSALIIFVASLCSYANPGHTAHTFNVRDGLPSNSISCIAQDRNGLIWIGTWNGLSFYDGYRFFTFRSNPRNGHLSTNRVLSVHPDASGNVWFTTYDHRLNLLDNATGKFRSLADLTDSELADSTFDAGTIYEAGGMIWVTSTDGKTILQITPGESKGESTPYKVTQLAVADLVPNASQIMGVSGDDTSAWIATDRGTHLAGTEFTAGGAAAGVAPVSNDIYVLSRNGEFNVLKDHKALLRLPSPGNVGRIKGLLKFDDNTLAAPTADGIIIYNIRHRRWDFVPVAGGVSELHTDSGHHLWAFTADGRVARVNSAGQIEYIARKDAADSGATSFMIPLFAEDEYGTIWLAPAGGQLGYYDEASNSIIPNRAGASDNFGVVPEVERYFMDRNHNLWVYGTHGISLVHFTYQNYRNLPLDPGHETRALCVMHDGGLLAGSAKGVVARYNPDDRLSAYIGKQVGQDGQGRWVPSQTPVRISDKVYSIFEDNERNIWLGTKGDGVYVLSPGGRLQHYSRLYGPERHIDCDSVYAFDIDNRGNMWVATYGRGLLRVEPRTDGSFGFVSMAATNPTYPKEHGYSFVRRITHNDDGEVVLSCNAGLLSFADSALEASDIVFVPTAPRHGDATSLRTSNVMQTLVADDGSIFITSMGGEVQRLVGNSLTANDLTFETPHNADLQTSLAHGNVLSMVQDRSGNFYFVRESDIVAYFPAEHSIVMLGRNLLGGDHEFTEAMPAVGPDGSLYFGSIGHVVKVDPADVAKQPFKPNIIFTGMKYDGEVNEQFILNPENIELEAGQRNFSISFAALDYSGYGRIEYAYRFEPDTTWTYLGSNNVLQITNLKPGVSRLFIRSTNGDGTWVDNERYVDILVHPTFWETVWAKLIVALLIVGIIIFLITYYNTYRRNRLMALVRKREHDFYVNASHQLRTPLALIGSPVYEVLNTEKLSDTGREHLERVRRSAKHMLNVVNTMLDARFRPDADIDDPMADVVTATGQKNPVIQGDQWLEAKDDPENTPTGISILVVEDNDDLRGFLTDILSAQYDIITASNGKEGLEKAEAHQPDFILTDITMPEMDGLTMVRHIKERKQLSHIPVIVLSARSSVEDRLEGLRIGIDDYISKPFSATYLRKRIANIIAQRRLLQQAYLERLGKDMNPGGADSASAETAVAGSNETPEASHQEYRLDSPQIIEADQIMMEKLMKFLEQRIGDENLRIEEMADAVSMGRTVFYGKIKAIVGMSPSDFLRSLRMQRAEELIVRSKMNFSQIAFSVGFSDPKYFTKCFKKETGMTPSDYRQQKSQEATHE